MTSGTTQKDSLEFQGMRFGRYEVIKRIAVGGMAEIFLARDEGVRGVSRQVVLKCVLPSISLDPSFVELFLDEIRIAARLTHQNIAHVYDFGEAEDRYFIAMEYIDGAHVSQLVRGHFPEMMPVEHAVKIGAMVAEALYYAHNQTDDAGNSLNIIHRDVSPENIMVSREGQVKLVDFGVAKAADQVHQTQVGVLRGKAAYLAPEQCRAQRMDRRADIFSLGIVLHEMLCGRRLFKRDNDFHTMKAVCSGSIPLPSSVRPSVPESLDRIVMKALERDLRKRYQQADEVSLELEQVLQEERLLSNQILLGRFVCAVLAKESASAGEGAAGSKGEISADGVSSSPSVSGVRQAPVPPPKVPRGYRSAEESEKAASPKRARLRTEAPELALSINLDEAIAEITGDDLSDRPGDSPWFNEGGREQAGAAQSRGEKGQSIDIDIDVELFSGAEMLSSALGQLAGRSGDGLDGPETEPSGSAPVIIEPSGRGKKRRRVDATRPDRFKGALESTSRPPMPRPPVVVSPPVHLGKPATAAAPLSASGRKASRGHIAAETGRVVIISDETPADQAGTASPSAPARQAIAEAETQVWLPDGPLPTGLKPKTAEAGPLEEADRSGPWPAIARATTEIKQRRYRRRSWLGGLAVGVVTAFLSAAAVLWGQGLLDERPGSSEGPRRGAVTAKAPADDQQDPQPDVRANTPTAEPPEAQPETPPEAPDETQPETQAEMPPSEEEPPEESSALTPSTGTLTLGARSGDAIIIDDVLVTAEVASKGLSLGEGEHSLRVIRPRHRPWVKQIEVTPGKQLSLEAQPRRAGPRWGTLTIESDVEAELFVGGTLLGRTPAVDLVLVPGPHEVSLVALDQRKAFRRTTVRRGRSTELRFSGADFSKTGDRRPARSLMRNQQIAVARARTCLENADHGCCIQSLEAVPSTPATATLLIACYDRAGRLADACKLATTQGGCRSCSQFASVRCKGSPQ